MKRVPHWLAAMGAAGLLLSCGSVIQQSVAVPTFTPENRPSSAAMLPPNETADMALGQLLVADKNMAIEYSREAGFGEAWLDVDENGCDTRNDILKRDLTSETFRDEDCVVAAGRLQGPYTGKVIEFVRGRGTSNAVHVDHVVALSDAWKSGAWDDPQRQRVELANDPLNLLAVDGRTNSSKGDSDASEWLPPVEDYHCAYVARQVMVKTKYELSVTPSEKTAMQGVLAGCPGQQTPTE